MLLHGAVSSGLGRAHVFMAQELVDMKTNYDRSNPNARQFITTPSWSAMIDQGVSDYSKVLEFDGAL